MRLELELVDGGGRRPGPDLPPARITPHRRRLHRFELWVLFAFAAISMWVVAIDVWRVVFDGNIWTGTDGVYIVDQMQYLAWIKDASKHILASNLFVLRSGWRRGCRCCCGSRSRCSASSSPSERSPGVCSAGCGRAAPPSYSRCS